MDLNIFIESGLIEAFVLDQCTAEERALVEQMREQHPEVRAELEAVQQALEGFAASHAVVPPPDLRGRILDALNQEPDLAAPPRPTTPAAPATSPAPADVVQLPQRRNSLATWVLVAAAVLLGATTLWFNQQKSAAENRVKELEQQVNDCNGLRAATEEQLNRRIQFVRDTGTHRVVLAAADPAVGGAIRAVVYSNKGKCENALDLSTLPAPPAGKYYQFWAIVNSAPVSMGMVSAADTAAAWQELPCQSQAVAFAISLEDKPTPSATPTQVYLVGAI